MLLESGNALITQRSCRPLQPPKPPQPLRPWASLHVLELGSILLPRVQLHSRASTPPGLQGKWEALYSNMAGDQQTGPGQDIRATPDTARTPSELLQPPVKSSISAQLVDGAPGPQDGEQSFAETTLDGRHRCRAWRAGGWLPLGFKCCQDVSGSSLRSQPQN